MYLPLRKDNKMMESTHHLVITICVASGSGEVEVFMKDKKKLLIFFCFYMSVIIGFCYFTSRPYSSITNFNAVMNESIEIQPLAEASVVDIYRLDKNTSAIVETKYNINCTKEEIMQHYDAILKRRGWDFYKQQKSSEELAYLYRKGKYNEWRVVIAFPTNETLPKEKYTYSLSISKWFNE